MRSGQFRTTKTFSGSLPPRVTATSLNDSFVAMHVFATRNEHRSANRASAVEQAAALAELCFEKLRTKIVLVEDESDAKGLQQQRY